MNVLLDGKNLLYRGIFVSLNTKEDDTFVAISRIMSSYIRKFNPSSIHVFWDDKKENLWRREILKDYKESQCRDKAKEAEDNVDKYQEICKDIWSSMNIRQYQLDHMEADDLIFSFCYNNCNKKIMVVSNDGDMIQLLYRFDNVQLFSPLKKEFVKKPKIDPVTVKCLMGDKSDNISGYYGIGPKKALILASNEDKLYEFLNESGEQTYKQNRKLIDLSLCPQLIDNVLYTFKQSKTEISFKKDTIVEAIYSKYKLKGIMADFKSLILPFKDLGR